MGFFKRKTGEEERKTAIFVKNRHRSGYAYLNVIEKIDGVKERHKLYRLGMPAYYVSPGRHILTVNAVWSNEYKKDVSLKESVDLEVEVLAGHFYALNYNVYTQDFEFLECDPKQYSLVEDEIEAELAQREFDFNFKLVVIDELLHKTPSFEGQINAHIRRKNEFYANEENYDDEKYELFISNAMEYFKNIELTKKDLLKVESLTFDGGLEVYQMIVPDWDGEDDRFDIRSIKGIEYLPNLKAVNYISMIDEELIKEIEGKGIEIL